MTCQRIERIWGSILSVRSGPTRRQSPLPCSAPFRHAARERESRRIRLRIRVVWWIMMICHLNSFGMLWISRWQALYQSRQNLFESFDEYHDMQCIQYFDHFWSTIFCEFRLRCLSSWYLGRLPPGPWPLRIDVLGLLGRSGHVFAPQWNEKLKEFDVTSMEDSNGENKEKSIEIDDMNIKIIKNKKKMRKS